VVFLPQPSTRSACELLSFFPLMSYRACGCLTLRFWLATLFKGHCGDMRILKLHVLTTLVTLRRLLITTCSACYNVNRFVFCWQCLAYGATF